jgi:hypothetical protein
MLTIDLDVLDGATFVVRWKDLSAAIIAHFASEFGTEPNECVFDAAASASGMVKCAYKARGDGILEVPFCVDFDLGSVAERIAQRIVNHPALVSKGYRLMGGSICTERNGDIRITLGREQLTDDPASLLLRSGTQHRPALTGREPAVFHFSPAVANTHRWLLTAAPLPFPWMECGYCVLPPRGFLCLGVTNAVSGSYTGPAWP